MFEALHAPEAAAIAAAACPQGHSPLSRAAARAQALAQRPPAAPTAQLTRSCPPPTPSLPAWPRACCTHHILFFRSYPSICALRLRARHAPRPHPGHLHKARDGPCEFAPVVVTPPQSVHNVTGAQVYLSCEVRAVPTPVITWRKVTQSPEGTQVLEDLPGDHINIAVQVRGGPSDHEATAWILINPLRKEDEGVYLCHSANAVGEAQSHGTVTVLDLSKFTAPHLPAPEDRM
ncbi:insulin-like growth factor-binding protein-like 1 [Ailuropoda melanoleuca]|uniref:insulin-like growth factor-binding protein-like 1 n=1 Tax=Ailuropoda melanoleuca TaxID=9646 RepID=UPI0014949F33|nr:insulin-like growth factor-binding protein-like 1 [Ailuropoda melanoleuca]